MCNEATTESDSTALVGGREKLRTRRCLVCSLQPEAPLPANVSSVSIQANCFRRSSARHYRVTVETRCFQMHDCADCKFKSRYESYRDNNPWALTLTCRYDIAAPDK
ncbi:hypothetical protein F2P81_007393 [Scophthalmus maximus]|uniref:Uncharacterized protein n=1 Tax=Scophthalmus maximus TaxID=52904 RepID=A0A6A4T8H4_SCOMX|nr:hypothetical protein F2P81_007393 [Scophthalmus maximus]